MNRAPPKLPPSVSMGNPVGRRERSANTAPPPLPLPKTLSSSEEASAIDRRRACEKCGKDGRVVSNQYGVHVFCVCGNDWPISSTPLRPNIQPSSARGLSKVTSVEPDWEMAFREIGEIPNGQIGPKPRR